MMLDQGLPPFISPAGPAVSIVGAAGATIIFPNIIDILGYGVGQAPQASIIGNPVGGVFGQDAGLGLWRLQIQLNIGTSFVTANSATANFALQGAPDVGAPTYQPGTWETFAEWGPKPASELVAATPLGAGIFRMAMPPAPPATLTPRYLRMIMTVPSGTNFTAGTVEAAFLVSGRDDLQSAMRAVSSFVVA